MAYCTKQIKIYRTNLCSAMKFKNKTASSFAKHANYMAKKWGCKWSANGSKGGFASTSETEVWSWIKVLNANIPSWHIRINQLNQGLAQNKSAQCEPP